MSPSSSGSRPIRRRRLRAPSGDRTIFADPELPACLPAAESNHAHFAGLDYDVQGRSFERMRREARRQALAEAERFTASLEAAEGDRPLDGGGPPPPSPLVEEGRGGGLPPSPSAPDDALIFATGHQPELFHPGVWVKHFAIAELARAASRRGGSATRRRDAGATGLNLIVDNDIVKTSAVRVPAGGPDDPRIDFIPFDRPAPACPWEEVAVADRATLAAFPERVAEALAPLGIDPLARVMWPAVVAQAERGAPLGQCLAAGRHAIEVRWGVRNLELPLSRVCRTDAFLWFACHLIAHAPRFRELHNAALAEYRRVNRIRSANHPVPELAGDDHWHEAPFWVWRTASARMGEWASASARDKHDSHSLTRSLAHAPPCPERRRLLARRAGREIVLSDGSEELARLPLGPDREACCALEVLRALPRRGIKLRTRALTTTLFARLFLADLFVHGIGGAKYDELTDAIIRRFFGFEPPQYLTLSATLRLPAEGSAIGSRGPGVASDVRRLRRMLRDLEYSPHRFLRRDGRNRGDAEDAESSGEFPRSQAGAWTREGEGVGEWLARRAAAVASQPQTPDERRRRWQAIREANAHLQPCVARRRRAALHELAAAEKRLEADRILADREYAFCLYPEDTLRSFLLSAARQKAGLSTKPGFSPSATPDP